MGCGTVIKLPYSIGDDVYFTFINRETGLTEVACEKIGEIMIRKNGVWIRTERNTNTGQIGDGGYIFLDKEQAIERAERLNQEYAECLQRRKNNDI